MGIKKALVVGATEWGGRLAKELFGNQIPKQAESLFSATGISKIDADIFSKAIAEDVEVKKPLTSLFQNAADGNDDAFQLLEIAAKNFGSEDQARRIIGNTEAQLGQKLNGTPPPKASDFTPTTPIKTTVNIGGKDNSIFRYKAFTGENRINRDNVEFVNAFQKKTQELADYAAEHNNSLAGAPTGTRITDPNGNILQFEKSGKGNEVKFSWKSVAASQKATELRAAGQEPDIDSIAAAFERQGQPAEGVQSYLDLGQKVRSKLKSGITKFNRSRPKSKHISLEHTFDVKHFKRLQGEVEGFAGKGADELSNLRVLELTQNALTGAKARKLDIGDELIKNVREGTFTDYNQNVKEFIEFDLANLVNDFDEADWARLFDLFHRNPDMSVQEILVKMAKEQQVTKYNSGILHSPTGTGDQAFDNVVNTLKENPNAFDRSGMGGRINISDRD